MFNKIGVLLINLGTPDSPKPKDVKKYLQQFLNDPRVIDLSYVARKLLVNACIVPLRYRNSARAYQKIWTERGSPLRYYMEDLVQKMQALLGKNYDVSFGMRYGNPSIANALADLNHCQKLIVLPLFPQYSSAASGSAIQEFMQSIYQQWNFPEVIIKNYFYENNSYIHCWSKQIAKYTAHAKPQKLIFSYHGLPVRHVEKSGCHPNCKQNLECPAIEHTNQYCYRSQCYATSHAIAARLNLQKDEYSVTFQSRLGRTPWIKPYTDLYLPELRAQNIENIAMVSPSFVTDCLETLEEINIRTREQWLSLGGKTFTFIPCLNANDDWAHALAEMIQAY